MSPKIPIDHDKIAAFCRQWKIREFSLFGSVLRDDFRPESDVDVLISFESDAQWSLLEFVQIREELSRLLGRGVDLVEKEAMRNPFRRKEIFSTREVIYG